MGRKADLKDPSLKVMQGKFITTYGSGEINGDIVMAPVSIGGQMTTLPVGISKKESGFDDGFTDGTLCHDQSSLIRLLYSRFTRPCF